jgi:hypothetical protein
MLISLTDMRSSAELLSALRRIEIAVPARTGGRKTHHTETYVVCRLLSTLAAGNQLRFPLSVSRRDPPNDRPDVVILGGDGRVGIEITEAIPERFAALCALAEREFPGCWLPVEVFQWNQPLSTDEMRDLLRCRMHLGGWVSSAAEREWAVFMNGVIQSKSEKLTREDFEKYEQNWLSIYDNLPLPHVHLAGAIEFLRPMLSESWVTAPKFDTIFIEHGPVIAQLTLEASEHFPINDIWQSSAAET